MILNQWSKVEFDVMFSKNKNETITCRDWRKYSSDVLNAKLSGVLFNFHSLIDIKDYIDNLTTRYSSVKISL